MRGKKVYLAGVLLFVLLAAGAFWAYRGPFFQKSSTTDQQLNTPSPTPTPLPGLFFPPEEVRQKIAFLKDLYDKQIPIGVWPGEMVEEVIENQSQKRVVQERRFYLSGILTQKPRWKAGKAYLSLALRVDEKGGLSRIIEVLLGEGEKEIGVNLAEGGKEATRYTVKKVNEIVPLLKPNSQVRIEVITYVEEELLDDPICDKKCREITSYINNYAKEVDAYLQDLAKGKFYPPPKPIGVVLEIVFIK